MWAWLHLTACACAVWTLLASRQFDSSSEGGWQQTDCATDVKFNWPPPNVRPLLSLGSDHAVVSSVAISGVPIAHAPGGRRRIENAGFTFVPRKLLVVVTSTYKLVAVGPCHSYQ